MDLESISQGSPVLFILLWLLRETLPQRSKQPQPSQALTKTLAEVLSTLKEIRDSVIEWSKTTEELVGDLKDHARTEQTHQDAVMTELSGARRDIGACRGRVDIAIKAIENLEP